MTSNKKAFYGLIFKTVWPEAEKQISISNKVNNKQRLIHFGDELRPCVYEKVVDIIVVSEYLKDTLKLKLKQAFEKPKSFYDDNNKFILSERGLTCPKDILLTPKFVLIDTMIDNGQMAEVDWKEDEQEIRLELVQIIKAKNYDLEFSGENSYDNTDTFNIIESIKQKELRPLGYSLEILDINSDSYVFTIVPLDKQKAVEAMFSKMRNA